MQSKGSFFYEEQYTSDYGFTQRNTLKEKVLESFLSILSSQIMSETQKPHNKHSEEQALG